MISNPVVHFRPHMCVFAGSSSLLHFRSYALRATLRDPGRLLKEMAHAPYSGPLGGRGLCRRRVSHDDQSNAIEFDSRLGPHRQPTISVLGSKPSQPIFSRAISIIKFFAYLGISRTYQCSLPLFPVNWAARSAAIATS